MNVPIETAPTPAAMGESLAREILSGLRDAEAQGRDYVLGCPAGRTPAPVYRALAEQAAGLDLGRLHLILMDEFVECVAGTWRRIPTQAHHSCVGFAQRHILAGLPGLPAANLHAPEPQAPEAYERLIESLGGIDLFLLASGASDGHVAFNAPGTSLGSRTRIVRLAETTRQDNLSTFADFAALDEVPTHGVSIGLGTVVAYTREAVMMLHGAHKAPILARLRGLERFDPQWPASLIFVCRRPRLLIDAELASAGTPLS